MIHLTLHQLSAYLDGELAEASTELVRLHLSQCLECTQRFAHMEAQEEVLVRLLNHDPGEAFFEFLQNAISIDEGEAPPTWPPPPSRASGPESPADLLGELVGPEPETTAPAADVDAAFEGDPETLLPNVDAPAPTKEPEPVAAKEPARPRPPRPSRPPRPPRPLPPVHSPELYGRREGDRAPRRQPRGGAAAGWIVAGVMAVVALSIAFVTSRPRVSPLPIPAGGTPPASGETGAPPPAPGTPPVDDATTVASPGSEGAAASESDSTAADAPESATSEPDGGASDLELLELPVWARAKSIEPPPAPRPRSRPAGAAAAPAPSAPPATTVPSTESLVSRPPQHVVPVRRIITTRIDSSAGEPDPVEPPAPNDGSAPAPSIDPEFQAARRRSLEAARAMTASAFEDAAAAWQALLPRLQGEPEREAVGWREAAQARFQAWAVSPTPARRDAAVHAVRAYLLYAPPGPDRDQAWTWLGRLKQAAGRTP